MKLVSVVIPFYNSEKTLDRCIQSVVLQEYSNLDIILIDDGSTDESEKICQKYLIKEYRIRYFYQENQGVSSARNYGIDVAKGDYILFIDSDDYIDSNMISELLENMDISICGYSTYYIEEKKEISYITNYNELKKMDIKRDKFLKHLGYWMLNLNIICMPWNKLFNLKKIRDNNLYFPYEISYGEDLIFNLNYFNIMETVSFIPECLYHYEVGKANSLEGKYKDDIFRQQREQFQMILDLLEEKNLLGYYNKRNLACYFIGRVEYCIKMLFHKQCLLSIEEKKRRIRNIIEDTLVIKNLELVWSSVGENLNELIYLMRKQDVDSIVAKYSMQTYKNKNKIIKSYLEKIIQYGETVRILGIKITLKKFIRLLGKNNER